MKYTLTAEELAAMPGNSIGTKEAAAVLGCDRYSLNIAAKQGTLNIRHFFAGNRLRLSKADVLAFCGYIQEDKQAPAIIFSKRFRTGT